MSDPFKSAITALFISVSEVSPRHYVLACYVMNLKWPTRSCIALKVVPTYAYTLHHNLCSTSHCISFLQGTCHSFLDLLFGFLSFDVCFSYMPLCTLDRLLYKIKTVAFCREPSEFLLILVTPSSTAAEAVRAEVQLLHLSSYSCLLPLIPLLPSLIFSALCGLILLVLPGPSGATVCRPLQFPADVCAHVPESEIKLPLEALDNFKHLSCYLMLFGLFPSLKLPACSCIR